jgi:hypothetical protein
MDNKFFQGTINSRKPLQLLAVVLIAMGATLQVSLFLQPKK